MLYRRVILFVFLILMCGFSTDAQKYGFFLEGNARKATIPFTTYNNLIIITLTVNDKVPMKFIVDTGVRSIIFFNKNITDVLGVRYSKKIEIRGVGKTKTIVAFIATGIDFNYHNLRGKELSVLVLGEDYLHLRNHLGTDVHGIIGYDFFQRFIVNVNYTAEQLTLIKPQYFKKKRRYQSIPLEVKDTKPYITVPLQINDTTKIQARLMIDTGASHALILHTDSIGPLQLPTKNIEAILGRGLSGEIKGNLAYINGCEIGNYELKDVIASFPQDQSYSDSLLISGREGTMGGEILSKFNLIFDYYGENKLYLKRNSTFSQPFEYNMSGLEVVVEGNNLDQFKIHMVRKGSPADIVGLRKGDFIEEINSCSREKLELNRIYKTLTSKPGKWINMIVSRNGILIRYKFRLKKEI